MVNEEDLFRNREKTRGASLVRFAKNERSEFIRKAKILQ